MVMLIDSVRAHLMRGWLFAGGCDVKRILRARDPDVNDTPALPDRQRHRRSAGGGLDVARMPFAAPVPHHEPEVVWSEAQPLCVARPRPTQVAQGSVRK